jgi:hypothetical protein
MNKYGRYTSIPHKVKLKLFLCLTNHHAMKTYGRVDVWIHILLTSALTGSGQLHALAALPPEKEPPVPIG